MLPLNLNQFAGVPIMIAGDLVGRTEDEQIIRAADGTLYQIGFVQMEAGRCALLITALAK